jgi:hypothetical protein
MRQFFPGMRLQLPRDVCVSGTLQHLAVNGVGNDRLVFSRQILIQQLDHPFARDIQSCSDVFFSHNMFKVSSGLSHPAASSCVHASQLPARAQASTVKPTLMVTCQ